MSTSGGLTSATFDTGRACEREIDVEIPGGAMGLSRYHARRCHPPDGGYRGGNVVAGRGISSGCGNASRVGERARCIRRSDNNIDGRASSAWKNPKLAHHRACARAGSGARCCGDECNSSRQNISESDAAGRRRHGYRPVICYRQVVG